MNEVDLLNTLSIKSKEERKNVPEEISKKGISGHVLEKCPSRSRGWQVTVTEDQKSLKSY